MGNLTDFIGGQHYTANDGTTQHLNIEVLTEAAYNLIGAGNYDANTLYLITNAA